MDTQTLDKLYLEYSHLTSARTERELKLEQQNQKLKSAMMGLADVKTIEEMQDMASVITALPAPEEGKKAILEALKVLIECHT